LIALFYKLVGRKSFVFDHHDVNPELYEAKFGRRDLFWKLLLAAERLTFKTADISIATNSSYRKIAIERGGMPPERVFVVRSGPKLERAKPVVPDPKWRNGRRWMVGYVGVMGPQEGLDLLLSAVEHIVRKRNRTNIQFVIVGNGPECQKIEQLCGKMALGDYVTFTGQVDDPTLFTILSTADVCVNCDRVTPMNDVSTMNKIMEYMAVGKPIVQFEMTEGRFSAQQASLYARANDPADFGDKILDLVADPERCARMGRFGRRRVHDVLAWPHEAPKLLNAYQTLFALRAERSGNRRGLSRAFGHNEGTRPS
jgi:glycosyltransferase involved in cell wall biosynthesis